MTRTRTSLVTLALFVFASQAVAGPTCTKEAKEKWLTEAQMMERIQGLGYKDIRNFHVSKGSCYEIYAFDKEGRKVEVYFHPISGDIAEANVN